MESLLIPWVLLLLLMLTIYTLVKKKWLFSFILFSIILILNYWSDCFCFGFKDLETGDLKILSFNVNGGGEYDENKTESIINLIKKESPDLLFLTENFRPLEDSLYEKLRVQYTHDTRLLHHNLIYSKYPLYNIVFYKRLFSGSSYVVKCNTLVKGKELTIVGCHLSSNNYSKDLNYLTPGKVNSLSNIETYITNMSEALVLREMEVDSILKDCADLERVIVMGDMNDVCGSPSMRKFSKSGFKDAWSKGGFGYGATIHHPLPYRIDHVLYNKGFRLNGIKKIDVNGISDHDALVAEFDISK